MSKSQTKKQGANYSKKNKKSEIQDSDPPEGSKTIPSELAVGDIPDSEIRHSDPPEGIKTIPSEPAVGDIPDGKFPVKRKIGDERSAQKH
jgi:hypothetical protein